MRRRITYAFITAVVIAVAAACGGGGTKSQGSSAAKGSSLPQCPLPALQQATTPVNITYWHAMTRANEEELARLTAQFNAQQQKVHVTLSAAPSYPDNFTRFKGGLATGNLPDLMQSDDTSTQAMIDAHAALPMASCIAADHATTDDLVPRVVSYYTVQNVLWGMPFNDSNPVLYYDKALFTKAGLDPNNPPRTLEEVKAASEKIVQSHAAEFGIALKDDSWLIEHWLAKAAHTIVNNGNGRTARATKVTFDDPTGVSLFQWIDDMTRAKLLLNTGTSDFNHYLAVGNSRAAMTIDSSAALGTISQLFAAGQYKRVQLGVGPMPGPASPDGGVLVGGAANYIVSRSAPAKQAAAYMFAKYLASPQVQAEWAAATGYVPVSKSAVTLEPLAGKYAQSPEYKVAYDELLAPPLNEATAGPVLGAYGAKGEGMRGAIIDAIAKVTDGSATPQQAVDQAAAAANAAIAEYNSRVG